MSGRPYDVVVWGATGYTGALTANHIARAFPTNVKWAIAGRSATKLQAVAKSCLEVNPDGAQPSIEICNLDEIELADLARKTTILIATIGPFTTSGEPALKACAENGTHYLDITGEIPWTMSMAKKYEKVAQSTGAILISQAAIESTPSDLVTYAIVSRIRQEFSTSTREVIFSIHDIKSQFSGGSLHSFLEVVDNFSICDLRRLKTPFIYSPIPGPQVDSTQSVWTTLLGVRQHPTLGTLTTYFGGTSDVAVVERSWGLIGNGKVYGPRFRFLEYARTSSILYGIFLHFLLTFGAVLLKLPLATWLLRKVIPERGAGSTPEETKDHYVEYRAVGRPNANTMARAQARVRYEGNLYALSGLLVAEAALTLLKNDVMAKKMGGGFLTPATLGQHYIDRLGNVGFKIEVEMVK